MEVETPDEAPSLEEAFQDHVSTRPLPPEHELDDAECHNCGEPWDRETWDVRHLDPPGSIMESWLFECPNCEEETFEVSI